MDTTVSRRKFIEGTAAATTSISFGAGAVSRAFGSEAAPALYKPGTYSAQVIGIDLMSVTLTFDEMNITDVQIDQNETLAVGGAVTGMLASQILETQSGDIDVITGASITSKAVRAAARNCIGQAMGSSSPLLADDCISPIGPADMPKAWDYEADIAIVGASVGGLVCAAKLAQGGKSVVVMEKEAKVGGTARITDCIGNYGGNGLWEGDGGYFATPYHDQNVIDYFSERANWSVDTDLLCHITVSLREMWDWWLDNGADLTSYMGWGIGDWWGSWVAMTDGHEGSCAPGHVHFLIEWLEQLCLQNGVEFLLSSPASALIADDGVVIGAEAEDPEGNVIYVKGNEATILAADSFQTNPKMLKAYGGFAGGIKSGLAKGTGRVIRMGQGVGADMAGIGSYAASTSMPTIDGYRAMLPMRRNYDCINYLLANPWCRFDAQGGRVSFVATSKIQELGDWNDCIDDNHRQCDQDLIHGDTFVVMGASWWDDVRTNGSTQFRGTFAGADSSADEWSRVTCETCLSDPSIIQSEWHGSTIAQSVEDSIAEGGIKRADTLEDLAELMGVSAEVVVDAVAAWNADCEAGSGDALHGYSAENMKPVLEPPFLGARVTPGLYAAFAGLKVTSENQVVDINGDPIEGLYAAFHTAGGIAGEHQHLCPIGDQIGSMGASGYNIAKSLLGEEWVTI